MAALVAAVVVGAAVAVVVLPDDDPADETAQRPPTTESPDPTGGPSSTPSTEPPASIDAVLDDLIAFVEQERGLTFEQRPAVRVVGDAEFEEALAGEVASARDLIEQDEALFRALGLIEPEVDLYQTLQDLYAAGVLGYYDPETDELLVRGTDAGPFVRQIVVHELTHALDDQRFDLDRQELDRAPDESAFGFGALVEGSAKRVESAYLESLPSEEREQAQQDALQFGLGADPGDVSIPLLALTQAAYTYGEVLVDELRGQGQAVLDAAFAEPPLTSEQVIDPSAYEAEEAPVDVAPPNADAAVVDRGGLGALVIDTVLTGGTGTVMGTGLDAAADGWGGDAFVSWRDGDRSCARLRVVGDTPADTTELRDGFTGWAEGEDATDVTTTDQGLVEVTSCR